MNNVQRYRGRKNRNGRKTVIQREENKSVGTNVGDKFMCRAEKERESSLRVLLSYCLSFCRVLSGSNP